MAEDGMALCPRCHDVELDVGKGSVGEDVCGGCGGRFLAPEISERVVVVELGFERELLREIAALFSGLRIACPGCESMMSPMRLRGVTVDLCLGCGGLWLDAGELRRLTSERHEEIGAKPPAQTSTKTTKAAAPTLKNPTKESASPAYVRLGRGASVVLFESLEHPAEEALRQAFTHTDGLTNVDAQMLARYNTGVVVEGVSAEGAAGLAALLQKEHVGAAVVADAFLRLPLAVQSSAIDVDDVGIDVRFHTGPPLHVPWAEVVAVVGGVVQRERLELKRPPPTAGGLLRSVPRNALDVPDIGTHEMVSSEDFVVEILQLGEVARRLRLVPAPGREREWDPASGGLTLPAQSQALLRLCQIAPRHTAVGRGPGRPLQELPHYRRMRELERELAWVAWRAARWPLSA